MEIIWSTPTPDKNKWQFTTINNTRMVVFQSEFNPDKWSVGKILNYQLEPEKHEIQIFNFVASEEDAKNSAYEYAMKDDL